jgi:hypothetical protein
MTDTPPPFMPYVPGPLDAAPTGPSVLAPDVPQPPKDGRGLLIGVTAGLGALVVLLGGTIALMASRDTGRAASPSAPAAVSPTPSYSPAAPYSPPPPKDISVAFGETLVVTDSAGGEVRYTVTADRVYTKTKYGTKPEKGVLYGVKVSVEVVNGTTYVCACDFALIAKDGTAYEGSAFQVSGGLDALNVNRGQKAAGIVVFDIPQGAQTGGRIELREGGRNSENQGFWTIP